MGTICKICDSNSTPLLKGTILRKYEIQYYKCSNCGFIQTEEPYWLNEAYQIEFDFIDVGLLSRNLNGSKRIGSLLSKMSLEKGPFLDFGGGSGILVRLMRDLGFDFYLSDKYNENIYAKYFESESNSDQKFEAITSLEVFEHFVDPKMELENLLKKSDTIIFSTNLTPKEELKSIDDWWYFVPESGQHLSLYSENSLRTLANEFNAYYHTDGVNFHIITKHRIKNPFNRSFAEKVKNKIRSFLEPKRSLDSLLDDDFQFYKKKINDEISRLST